MAAPQRQISDSAPVALIDQPQPTAAIHPISLDILPEPVMSPARALQERLHESAGDFLLPNPSIRSQDNLPAFILCTALLWGISLSAVVGLMILAR